MATRLQPRRTERFDFDLSSTGAKLRVPLAELGLTADTIVIAAALESGTWTQALRVRDATGGLPASDFGTAVSLAAAAGQAGVRGRITDAGGVTDLEITPAASESAVVTVTVTAFDAVEVDASTPAGMSSPAPPVLPRG